MVFLFPHSHHHFLFFLPVVTREDQGHAALPNILTGVVVGLIGVAAALADEDGLRGPIVRVKVAARGTFLRSVIGGNVDNEFAGALRLVAGVIARPAPGGSQNALMEARLASEKE